MRTLWIALASLICASAAGAQTLELTEDLVIDPTGTEAEFGRIADIAVASDGTIYVADTGFHVIHAFADDGTWLRSFGEAGDGPGDLPTAFFQMGIDADDQLLIAGTRSSIGRVDGYGQLVESIPLDMVPLPRSVLGLRDGSVAIISILVDLVNDPPSPPRALHVFGHDGTTLASFAGSSWWTPDVNPRYLRTLLTASADLDPATGEILYLEGKPFQLRRYTADGTLIAMTDQGFEGFVGDPVLPEIKDGGMTFRLTGGTAWRITAMPSGPILVKAVRIHPEDEGHDYAAQPDFQPRRQNLLNVYDRKFKLVATLRDDDLSLVLAADPEDRLLGTSTNSDGLPILVRYRYSIGD